MEKIKCVTPNCRAMILLTTAQDTGGVCMSCFRHHQNQENDELIEFLKQTPPNCIINFNKTLNLTKLRYHYRAVDETTKSVWDLACSCGCKEGYFLGHPLSDFTEKERDKNIFVSPLAFECSSCQKITEILDTKLHGYHAEVGKLEGQKMSTKYRGSSKGQKLACQKCHNELFHITVGFEFFSGAIEAFREEQWQYENFFDSFLCSCTCSKCDYEVTPTQFGQL